MRSALTGELRAVAELFLCSCTRAIVGPVGRTASEVGEDRGGDGRCGKEGESESSQPGWTWARSLARTGLPRDLLARSQLASTSPSRSLSGPPERLNIEQHHDLLTPAENEELQHPRPTSLKGSEKGAKRGNAHYASQKLLCLPAASPALSCSLSLRSRPRSSSLRQYAAIQSRMMTFK